MKKLLAALALCLCTLTACQDNSTLLSGDVTALHRNDQNEVVSLVMQTDTEEIGILLTDTTHFSKLPDNTAFDLRSDTLEDARILVHILPTESDLTTQDGRTVTTYTAEFLDILSCRTGETASLSDGTVVERWAHSNSNSYVLPDGTELLRVQHLSGPDQSYVSGQESFDDLSEDAKPHVLAFYEEQGLLYDVPTELEKAYRGYLEKPDDFDGYYVGQDISPTASNDKMMYFLTATWLPIDNTHATELRLGAAFDRTTGEHIPNADLFTVPPEQVIEKLIEIAGINDPMLQGEMKCAFDPETIILFPDNLEINFPEGTLPSQQYTYSWGFKYRELSGLLHDWAVPSNR